jgi:hypothetical protein
MLLNMLVEYMSSLPLVCGFSQGTQSLPNYRTPDHLSVIFLLYGTYTVGLRSFFTVAFKVM